MHSDAILESAETMPTRRKSGKGGDPGTEKPGGWREDGESGLWREAEGWRLKRLGPRRPEAGNAANDATHPFDGQTFKYGAEGDRTLNPCLAKAVLSQLSYGPVGRGATSCVSGRLKSSVEVVVGRGRVPIHGLAAAFAIEAKARLSIFTAMQSATATTARNE